jgi:hypothetical protein
MPKKCFINIQRQMKKLLTFIFLSTCLISFAQQRDNRLTIGIIDSVYSPTLKEMRKIWVYIPPPHGSGANQKQHFPVLYLLDGDSHFFSVAGMLQQLSEVNNNSVCPDMVIIGILNTDRARDFTPSHVTSSYYFSRAMVKNSGGSENFTRFLEKELMPYVETHYPVAPYRILIGHSLGGLFVMNTLVNHTNLFNSYVAIDPSLWWDDQRVLKQAKIALEQKKFTNKSLFFAVAHTMDPKMDTTQVATDTTSGTIHMRSNLIFTKYLTSKSNNGLNYKWKYYDNDNHFSVPLIAEYDALHFLFDFYTGPESDRESLTAEILSAHYKLISSKFGYTMLPPEAFVNSQGYIWLQRKVFDKAYAYFNMNIENYPDNANEYDSMADYFIAKKDPSKAIEYLMKAIACKDATQATRQKLAQLKTGHTN